MLRSIIEHQKNYLGLKSRDFGRGEPGALGALYGLGTLGVSRALATGIAVRAPDRLSTGALETPGDITL